MPQPSDTVYSICEPVRPRSFAQCRPAISASALEYYRVEPSPGVAMRQNYHTSNDRKRPEGTISKMAVVTASRKHEAQLPALYPRSIHQAAPKLRRVSQMIIDRLTQCCTSASGASKEAESGIGRSGRKGSLHA